MGIGGSNFRCSIKIIPVLASSWWWSYRSCWWSRGVFASARDQACSNWVSNCWRKEILGGRVSNTFFWALNRLSICSQWDESGLRIGCGVIEAPSNSGWQMTTANWKTNEVLISSLGSGVCVCAHGVCSRERDKVRGHPCQVQMLINKQKLAKYAVTKAQKEKKRG